ncbi:hypothetical protein ISCU110981_19870 [Isoptericola cucumis]
MSVSALRPVSLMVASACTAAGGSAAAAYRPPSACATTIDSECATMSCISRAIRARSAAAPMRACWSRSISRRCARSRSASIATRRERRTRANAHTARPVTRQKSPTGIVSMMPDAPSPDRAATAMGSATTLPTAVALIAVMCAHVGPYVVTEKRATSTSRSPGMIMGKPTTMCASATAKMATAEGTGLVRRQGSGARSATVQAMDPVRERYGEVAYRSVAETSMNSASSTAVVRSTPKRCISNQRPVRSYQPMAARVGAGSGRARHPAGGRTPAGVVPGHEQDTSRRSRRARGRVGTNG